MMLSGGCCRCQRVWRWTVLLPHRIVDTLRDAHVDDTSFMSCPSLLQHCFRLQCRAGVYPHGTLHFFTRVQRVRCSCTRNGLLPLQHGGQGPAMHAENVYGQGVCTHCPNGATVQKRAARGTSTLLARGTGCGRPLA